MPICDDVFRKLEIPFDAAFQDLMVYTVWREYGRDKAYAKWLILCWFDQTFGEWQGTTFNVLDSRSKMSAWLEQSQYASFEELLDRRPDDTNDDRQQSTGKPKPTNN